MIKTFGPEVDMAPSSRPPAAGLAMLFAQEQTESFPYVAIEHLEVLRRIPDGKVVTPPAQYRVEFRDGILEAPTQADALTHSVTNLLPYGSHSLGARPL
jgi:hypothetical protein